TLVMFVMAVSLMLRIDVRLTLVSLLPLPVLSFVVARLGGSLHKLYETIQAQFSTMTAKAQETLSGIRVVKAHVEEEGEYESFRKIHEGYLDENRKMIRLWSMMWPLMSLLGGIAGAIVLSVGGAAVVHGTITLGEMVAFQIYLAMLIWPMIALGWVSNLFQRGAASMTRIQVVLDLPIEEDVDPPGVEPVPGALQPHAVAAGAVHAFDGSIELRAVGYRYPETERWVLRGVDLRVKPGESVALVGRTGAGKTTLLHLVERLFEPTEGVVLLGGIPAAEWPRRALRRSLGIVPQESFLFSDTIRANIGFGFDDGETSPDPEAVARQAGLGSDLSQFPQGLETMIGERGITLSGGQKQRVALARALALKRRALILDDAFASVDPGTEEQILETLFGLPTKPTILLATHRRSALLRVDRVVVLDEGKIVASGTHEELLRAGGLYADLYHEEEVVEELEAL
ncbi:MAG TPA: ABC transporter ATP-binding protein, partial [Candidatus Eisenbacteria bacterium]|nr:ABC transporter ATP-binding protein [Candidatus Eisenbacteria bacterium]